MKYRGEHREGVGKAESIIGEAPCIPVRRVCRSLFEAFCIGDRFLDIAIKGIGSMRSSLIVIPAGVRDIVLVAIM